MAGESELMEQAKKQWEKFDAEGRKIINDLITEDTDRKVWPENTESKFIGKKGAKMTRVTYDTEAKKYTYQENTLTAGELIRLDIPESYIYFSYHPTKQEYVMIDAPNRHEPDAKFIVTAPFCHWIWERNITVLALLLYTIQNAHSTRSNVQKAIKEATSEEMLRQKIAEQKCYTELVDIILTAITDLSEVEDLSASHEAKVERISGMIEFMQDKGVRAGCKTLTKETVFSDFITAGHDTETMNWAKDIINTKMPAHAFITQWKQ